MSELKIATNDIFKESTGTLFGYPGEGNIIQMLYYWCCLMLGIYCNFMFDD